MINVSGLTFGYEGGHENIFENVSFQMDTDWKLGFTGRNGRGKTTFLNLLRGKYDYFGKIDANVTFEYFPYHVMRCEKNTADILREICASPDWELLRELSLLDVSEDVMNRPFKTMSSGEQTKTLLAALFLKGNNFLLIDEPTNHLDMFGRRAVCEYLRTKKGFILVSHDRALLDGCVDHILSINKTNIEVQKGNFSSWWENKKRQDNFEIAQNENLKKDIKRLSKAALRTAEWSDKCELSKNKRNIASNSGAGLLDKGYVGHKAAKMMKRSKAIEMRQNFAIDEKSQLLRNIDTSENLKIFQLEYHTNTLISLDGVSVFYGENEVCHDVSFVIERGDRIALRGKNGSGKSSILKLICGAEIKYRGNFHKGSGVKISYVPQDTSFLRGRLADYAGENGIDEALFKSLLRKLDFSRVQFEKDIQDFSAGQKKKVLIAKSLCEQVHLHVWDEPLNFIDVISRIQIEKLLTSMKPTVLFVEHDIKFCENIATKTVLLL